MQNNYRFRSLLSFLFLALIGEAFGQNKQSIIYDAVSMLNANHKVTVLLVPLSINKFDIINPITGVTEMHDATGLQSGDVDSVRGQEILKIILKRNAGLKDDATDADLRSKYKDNPFLHQLVERLTTRSAFVNPNDALPLVPRISGLDIAPVSAGIGSNILGNLANGVADFLIRRAQEELTITVVEKLQKFLLRYPEIDTLFPKTCELLKPFEAYEYSTKLTAIKDAIHEDLENLVARIPLLYNIPRYQILNQKIPELSLVFSASTIVTDLDGSSKGIGKTLSDLNDQPYLKQENNYTSILKIICLLSASLRAQTADDPHPDNYSYVSPGYILNVTQNNPVFIQELSNYYLGLIWEHCQDIYITSSNKRQSFSELLNHWSAQPSGGIQFVQNALNGLLTSDQYLDSIKNIEIQNANVMNTDLQKKIVRFKTYSKIVEAAVSLTDLFTSGPGEHSTDFHRRVHEIRIYLPSFTQNVSDMIEYFDAGKYNLGVNAFSRLVETVSQYMESLQDGKHEADKKATIALIDADIQAQLIKVNGDIALLQTRLDSIPVTSTGGAVQESSDNSAERRELARLIAVLQAEKTRLGWQSKNSGELLSKWSKIMEYMDLLASISQAENSAAVESLLEAYALPAGSSRIKKDTKWNISVNAYVGAFARTNSPVKGFSATWGLTAPIGVAFSHGLGASGDAGSLSVFLGAFDVGAIINYKVNNQGEYEQNINFAGIVSPSTQLVYGFFDHLPISIGLGCQWTSPPSVTGDQISLTAHFNAFLAIDIPLFNLTAVKKKD